MDTDRYLKICKELDDIKGMLKNVNDQMQELRQNIRGAPISTTQLPMSKPYIHPWWQYQWTGSESSGNNLRGQIKATEYNPIQAGSRVSGAKTQTQSPSP